jgi:hypothetical protein
MIPIQLNRETPHIIYITRKSVKSTSVTMLINNQLVVTVLLLFSQSLIIVRTCTIERLTTAEELVSQAYAIARAKALNYGNANMWTDGSIPMIRFQVEEIVKGNNSMIPNLLLIPGYLSQDDDFNDHFPPYNFVRSNGRSGVCFAFMYKQNASYLLFLNSEYSPYWDALTPVNEQLHSPPSSDPWLQWVKTRVAISTYGPVINKFVTNGANKLQLFFF